MKMTNTSKFKSRKNPLGLPPELQETTNGFCTSETVETTSQPTQAKNYYPRLDGRSARKTNRIFPFATRVSEDFDRRFRMIAQRDGLMIVELLELALDAYEKQKDIS